jgi:hypothetical protein
MGRNFDKRMAKRKISAREAMLLRAEDEGDAGAGPESGENDGRKEGKRDDGLLGLAAGERAGAEDESAIGDGVR